MRRAGARLLGAADVAPVPRAVGRHAALLAVARAGEGLCRVVLVRAVAVAVLAVVPVAVVLFDVAPRALVHRLGFQRVPRRERRAARVVVSEAEVVLLLLRAARELGDVAVLERRPGRRRAVVVDEPRVADPLLAARAAVLLGEVVRLAAIRRIEQCAVGAPLLEHVELAGGGAVGCVAVGDPVGPQRRVEAAIEPRGEGGAQAPRVRLARVRRFRAAIVLLRRRRRRRRRLVRRARHDPEGHAVVRGAVVDVARLALRHARAEPVEEVVEVGGAPLVRRNQPGARPRHVIAAVPDLDLAHLDHVVVGALRPQHVVRVAAERHHLRDGRRRRVLPLTDRLVLPQHGAAVVGVGAELVARYAAARCPRRGRLRVGAPDIALVQGDVERVVARVDLVVRPPVEVGTRILAVGAHRADVGGNGLKAGGPGIPSPLIS